MAKNDYYIPEEVIDDEAFPLLLKLIEIELRPLISDPFKGQSLPSNEPSTIKTKKAKGLSPKPLEATGRLKDSIEITVDETGIHIKVMGYYLYQKKDKYFGKLMNIGQIKSAITRAITKWNLSK